MKLTPLADNVLLKHMEADKKDFGNHRERDHAGRGDSQRLCCPVRLAEL